MTGKLGKLTWGMAASLAMLTGCQTWVPQTGQTLPSPNYLDHPPQYIPPTPPYPLPNEMNGILAAQQAQQQARPQQ
jgi:hypothetical protein